MKHVLLTSFVAISLTAFSGCNCGVVATDVDGGAGGTAGGAAGGRAGGSAAGGSAGGATAGGSAGGDAGGSAGGATAGGSAGGATAGGSAGGATAGGSAGGDAGGSAGGSAGGAAGGDAGGSAGGATAGGSAGGSTAGGSAGGSTAGGSAGGATAGGSAGGATAGGSAGGATAGGSAGGATAGGSAGGATAGGSAGGAAAGGSAGGATAGGAAGGSGLPALSIDDVSVAEGNSGTTTATFTVTLAPASMQTVTVDFATADDTAIVGGTASTGGVDFVSNSGTLTFPAGGPLTQTVTITVNGDALNEATETFNVVLTNASNADISKATGVGSITNDDATPGLTIGSTTVAEGNSGTTNATFTVTLSAASGQSVTVNFAAASGTATVGDDFQATTGVLTFAPSETTKQIVVPVVGDALDEADETFTVALTAPVNATVVAGGGIGTITDDDATPTVSIDDVLQTEGNAGTLTPYAFDVTLSAASGRTVTVAFATASNTATSGTDFVAATGVVTFAPGETSKPVTVTVNGDGVVEPDESFFVNLSMPVNATIADAQGIGFIVNDDALGPTLTLQGPMGATPEGNTGTRTQVFTVTLSAAATSVVTVNYATRDVSAIAGGIAAQGGRDYDAASGVVTFPIGSVSQTFAITINGDTLLENFDVYRVELSGAVNASIGTLSVLSVIDNDDALPQVSINDVTVTEGAVGTKAATFTLSLNAAAGRAVNVSVATSDGTASSAGGFAQNDFGALGLTTITFPAGVTSVPVSIVVNGDTTYEVDETFNVVLSNPFNVTILDGTGIATIQNDDAQPALSINDLSQAEGSGGGTTPMRFTASLSAPSALPVSFTATTVAGTATSNADYLPLTAAPFTIPAGGTAVFVTVQVASGAGFEADETFFVDLGNPNNATFAKRRGNGIILNDDAPGVPTNTITISDATVLETNAGTTTVAVIVTLNRAVAGPVSLNWTTNDLTATVANADYVARSATQPFTGTTVPGTEQVGLVVTINGDLANEANERLLVNLTSATNATIVDSQAVVTIQNDDNLPTLTINNVTLAEGNTGSANATFTVGLSAASGQTVTALFDLGGGTASPLPGIGGTDYVDSSGALTFAPGETTKTIIVPVNGDTTFENDDTFVVTLSSPVNATLATAAGTGTITNDDTAPSVTIADVSQVEGRTANAVTLSVTLSQASAVTITLTVATANGTATGGSDYQTITNGVLVIDPGVTVRTVSGVVLGDTITEANETFFVNLSMPVACTIADGQALVTILNDD